MEHTNESILVKVADLVPSPYNVRRHSRASIEELAALIDSQGLLHSPTVHEHFVGRGKSRRLAFAVSAGVRRRRALRLLQERGSLPRDHEVTCQLIPIERAREVSVAENSGREPMLGRVFDVSCLSFLCHRRSSTYRETSQIGRAHV